MATSLNKCPHCVRNFAADNDLYQHLKSKHPKAKRHHLHAGPVSRSEPSTASRLVDAIIAYNCGEAVDMDLLFMFPYEFEA